MCLQDYIAFLCRAEVLGCHGIHSRLPTALPRLATRLPEITVPCQLIVGRHDPFVPVSNAEGLHKGLPKSKLNVIDCGHFVWEDASEDYGRLPANSFKEATPRCKAAFNAPCRSVFNRKLRSR